MGKGRRFFPAASNQPKAPRNLSRPVDPASRSRGPATPSMSTGKFHGFKGARSCGSVWKETAGVDGVFFDCVFGGGFFLFLWVVV